MENIIIIAIIVIMLIFGVIATIKHFKGEGGCCGGSDLKLKPRRLKKIIKTITVGIDGMTCQHCRTRVENALNEMPGISARVNLKKKEARISMDREIENNTIKDTIENAGYSVTHIN